MRYEDMDYEIRNEKGSLVGLIKYNINGILKIWDVLSLHLLG
jgi:hypothetical protein